MKIDTSKQHIAPAWQVMAQYRNAYRADLAAQITRDMQTLGQTPVPHPGEDFYADRVEAYLTELLQLDQKITDRETSQHEGK